MNDYWYILLVNSFLMLCIICMCIIFILYLLFKPLRTHLGELLMISAFFAAYWLYFSFLDDGNIFYSNHLLKFINIFYGYILLVV